MQGKMLTSVLFIALGLFTHSAIQAAEDAHEHREHGAHEHGVGQLDVVIQGNEVVLALDGPAANIIGFEHAPGNDKERATLDQAIATLKAGDKLFLFSPEAGCHQTLANIDTSLLSEHEDHDEEEHHHADLEADYQFHCDQPDSLEQIKVKLFEAFPATHLLQVQMVTPKGQSGAKLSPSNTTLSF